MPSSLYGFGKVKVNILLLVELFIYLIHHLKVSLTYPVNSEINLFKEK